MKKKKTVTVTVYSCDLCTRDDQEVVGFDYLTRQLIDPANAETHICVNCLSVLREPLTAGEAQITIKQGVMK